MIVPELELRRLIEDSHELEVVFEGREESVPFMSLIDVGEVKFAAAGQEGLENLGASDDENIALDVECRELIEGRDQFRALGCFSEGSAEDNVTSSGQNPRERVEGLAPHEDGMIEGGALEELEVFGQVPGKSAVTTDDAIAGHRDNSLQLDGVSLQWIGVPLGWGSGAARKLNAGPGRMKGGEGN